MDNITAQQYFTECRDIARETVAECAGDEEQIHDRLHETIDGHQWVIYTFYNMQVLAHSRNENAYFDEFGKLDAEDFSSCMAKLAYAALMADVQEELSEALKNYHNDTAAE